MALCKIMDDIIQYILHKDSLKISLAKSIRKILIHHHNKERNIKYAQSIRICKKLCDRIIEDKYFNSSNIDTKNLEESIDIENIYFDIRQRDVSNLLNILQRHLL